MCGTGITMFIEEYVHDRLDRWDFPINFVNKKHPEDYILAADQIVPGADSPRVYSARGGSFHLDEPASD